MYNSVTIVKTLESKCLDANEVRLVTNCDLMKLIRLTSDTDHYNNSAPQNTYD